MITEIIENDEYHLEDRLISLTRWNISNFEPMLIIELAREALLSDQNCLIFLIEFFY